MLPLAYRALLRHTAQKTILGKTYLVVLFLTMVVLTEDVLVVLSLLSSSATLVLAFGVILPAVDINSCSVEVSTSLDVVLPREDSNVLNVRTRTTIKTIRAFDTLVNIRVEENTQLSSALCVPLAIEWFLFRCNKDEWDIRLLWNTLIHDLSRSWSVLDSI
jgi:hypothetical protein